MIVAFLKTLTDFFGSAFFSFLMLILAVFGIILLIYKALAALRSRMIARIGYTRYFSETGVHAGDSVLLTEVISNPTILPLFFIEVGTYISTGLEIDGETAGTDEKLQYFTSRFHLLPFTKVTRTHEVKCKIRNHYVINTAEIYSDKKFVYISAPAELYVYPEPLNSEDRVLPQLNLLGNDLAKNRFLKDPFYIAGLRDYLPGDPFSSINFKASARAFRGGARQLVVNNNDFSAQLNVMIYMDFNVPRSFKMITAEYNRAIEAGLSYSAEILCDVALQGGKAGFACNARGYDGSMSVHHEPHAGMVHMVELFKCMSALEPYEGMSFAALLDRDIGRELYDTDICIITFHVDAEVDSRIQLLQRYGRGVTVISLDRMQ